MNYSTEYKPRITSVIDFGFALGYNEKYDLIGRVLTPHIKLNDGYLIKNCGFQASQLKRRIKMGEDNKLGQILCLSMTLMFTAGAAQGQQSLPILP